MQEGAPRRSFTLFWEARRGGTAKMARTRDAPVGGLPGEFLVGEEGSCGLLEKLEGISLLLWCGGGFWGGVWGGGVVVGGGVCSGGAIGSFSSLGETLATLTTGRGVF